MMPASTGHMREAQLRSCAFLKACPGVIELDSAVVRTDAERLARAVDAKRRRHDRRALCCLDFDHLHVLQLFPHVRRSRLDVPETNRPVQGGGERLVSLLRMPPEGRDGLRVAPGVALVLQVHVPLHHVHLQHAIPIVHLGSRAAAGHEELPCRSVNGVDGNVALFGHEHLEWALRDVHAAEVIQAQLAVLAARQHPTSTGLQAQEAHARALSVRGAAARQKRALRNGDFVQQRQLLSASRSQALMPSTAPHQKWRLRGV
mmetsp:Transcript_7130/g.27306  ORF Transcript_7130/g.27306 Transcript_7130/m.27306 type:complete len:260 (+) Transcript_7130:930-1709(+)